MFRLSRSNKNIIRKAINSNNNYDSYVSKLRSSFLPERVRNYWNNLPDYVKFSVDVPSGVTTAPATPAMQGGGTLGGRHISKLTVF